MHSSPLSSVSSETRSRSPEAESEADTSHQAQLYRPSHDTRAEEPRESAIHVSDGTGPAVEHTPPTHGKRKPSLENLNTRKRQKSNSMDDQEQPIAGPSRVTLPEDRSKEVVGALTTEGLVTGRPYHTSSASAHYSPTGELLYPDAGSSRHPRPLFRSGASGRLGSSSKAAPAREELIDVDTVFDSGELLPTQLTAHRSSSTVGSMSIARILNIDEREEPSSSTSPAQPASHPPEPSPRTHSPPNLSGYFCPICFSPPTYATLTPCGHICCGDCLFTAVKTSMQRSVYLGPAASSAKCPVCRAPIPGWDGKGGGVIGLKTKVVHDISGSPAKSNPK